MTGMPAYNTSTALLLSQGKRALCLALRFLRPLTQSPLEPMLELYF